MTTENNFSYLVRINVGIERQLMIVVNNREVPRVLLETMAKEKTEKFIHTLYTKHKHFRTQTSESFFVKTLRESSFEIEDLNKIEIIDIQLIFDKQEKIENTRVHAIATHTKQSSFNEDKN